MTRDAERGTSRPNLVVILGLACLLLIALGLRGCWTDHMPGMNGLSSPLFGGWFQFSPWGLLSLGGLIQIGLAVWVGLDAQRRGMNGLLWGLLVFFTFIVGLLVYLIVTQWGPQSESAASPGAPVGFTAASGAAARTAKGRCPGCEAPLAPDFKLCPYCGTPLRCDSCGQPAQAGWKLCPHCGNSLRGPAAT